MSRIYLASSWRNEQQPDVVAFLRNLGHQVYDFKNPDHGMGGFGWSEIDPNWRDWSPEEYRQHLQISKLAARGFMSDFRAMRWCDTCVMLLPCGRSAHLELGWCSGAGKRTIIMLAPNQEPELMALLADEFVIGLTELEAAVGAA